MSEFDEILATGANGATGRFGDGWVIGNAVNGGIVMAAALSALADCLARDPAETTAHVDPVVISAYFTTASLPGEYHVDTEVVRAGRMLSTGAMSVTQQADGQRVERMRAIASFGNLGDLQLDRQPEPPTMPPPEQCLSMHDSPAQFEAPAILHRLDLRLDPASAGWAVGKPSMAGRMRGWLRMADGREPDPLLLMAALDFLPPVAFDLGFMGWAPTLEFTGHVRKRPAPGWLLVELASDTLGGGLMEEDARIWDSTGALVAQSRQLCSIRVPGAGPGKV